MWQFLCDEFYLLVYMRTFARILGGKYICQKTSLPVFMWQTKIVNYEYLFVYISIWLVTYLSHAFICTFSKLCAIKTSLLKPSFCVELKSICCIIYTSNRICHGKLSNKSSLCKRGFMVYEKENNSNPCTTELYE